jgi:putative oxidoreductase
MTSVISATRAPRTMTTIRWAFGIYFVGVGILHFVLPQGLPTFMAWMYELSDPLHAVAGTAEILGGLGLILPSLVGVAPRLTSGAASGLSLLMLGAAAWHGSRGEWAQILGNLVVAGIMAYVAVKEWRAQQP